jgi:hypothetical protein
MFNMVVPPARGHSSKPRIDVPSAGKAFSGLAMATLIEN